MLKGFDVSKHQQSVDWNTVGLQNLDFCFIRIGYRGYSSGKINLDERFLENFDGVKKIGMPHGFYFFSSAINLAEAIEEARFVISVLNGHKCKYPIVYDFEGYMDPEKRTYVTTKKSRTEFYLAFKKIMNENGYRTMVYEGQAHIRNTYDLNLIKDPIWCARYAGGYDKVIDDISYKPQIGQFTDRIYIWQYTSIGKIPGIVGNVDLNFCYDGVYYCLENPYTEPNKTLFLGNIFQTKEDVNWLKWHLKRLNYLPKNVPYDGKFDKLVSASFRLFQKYHTETYTTTVPDGKCGKLSRRALALEV